jgi:transposase-like protein
VLVLEYTGVSSILRTRCNLRETPWKRAKGSTKNIKDGGAAILRRTLSAKQCNCWSKGIETLKQLSEELGVSDWSLRQWKKFYGQRASASAESDLEQENTRLRRELEAVRTEREILKKALTILGQESCNDIK